MFGYFVRRVDKRFQLERQLGLRDDEQKDAVARLERMFNTEDEEQQDRPATPSSSSSPSTSGASQSSAGQSSGGSQGEGAGLGQGKKKESPLRKYIESFDQATLADMTRQVVRSQRSILQLNVVLSSSNDCKRIVLTARTSIVCTKVMSLRPACNGISAVTEALTAFHFSFSPYLSQICMYHAQGPLVCATALQYFCHACHNLLTPNAQSPDPISQSCMLSSTGPCFLLCTARYVCNCLALVLARLQHRGSATQDKRCANTWIIACRVKRGRRW